jgi:hypothetical protein
MRKNAPFCRVVVVGVVCGLVLGGSGTALSEEAQRLAVVNGDFEHPKGGNPPVGWAMWGPDRDKISEHFITDRSEARSGKACLRIYHPAKTRGYIVTDPQHAIRPAEGMAYEVRFWAKGDRPRKARFSITAYRSIRPFVDAPSPGAWPIEVGPKWQSYRFEFSEGLDFFADESQYLLLTFSAVTDQAEEGTLWVDDVEVWVRPSPQPRVLNPATLKHPPVEHRLRPGSSLQVVIDTTRSWGPTTREVTGISFHRVAGWTGQPFDREGRYRLTPGQEEAIRQLKLPMSRFYAVGDEPFPVQEALDRIAWLCDRVSIPQEWMVIELEEQSAARKIPPEVWASAVQHAKKKGYRFRFWEVSNEPYSSLWGKGGAFSSAEDYMEHFKAVAKAIRSVDNSAQVGVAIHPRNVRWGNLVLKQTAGEYDFVVGHYYSFPRIFQKPFEEVVITENMRTLDLILKIQALIREYNGSRPIYQLDTEWGLHAGGPAGERADYVDRNANIWGVLHRAVRMIYYAREGLLRGASGWQMLSRTAGQGFAILFSDAPESRSMLYWLYYYFNRHLGPELVAFEGEAPFYTAPSDPEGAMAAPLTPLVITRDSDGRQLWIILANGSWNTAVPIHLRFRGFRPVKYFGTLLTDDDLDGKPLVPAGKTFARPFRATLAEGALRGELPAHSVVFLTLEGQSLQTDR